MNIDAYSKHEPIRILGHGCPVDTLLDQIEAHPGIWNKHSARTQAYGTPHSGISDIWVRYNAFENYHGDLKAFNDPHVSVWYDVIKDIPAVVPLVELVARHVCCETIGGVLITKIPPGKCVEPHVDTGWHASFYSKFAVQLKGNSEQGFHFIEKSVHPEPGDLYTFDNSKLHWVSNDSSEDRMTLIICLR